MKKMLIKTMNLLPAMGLACGMAQAAVPTLPDPALDTEIAKEAGAKKKIVLAGGCFWGVQAVFLHMKGVEGAVSGYAGGDVEKPSYHEVTTGKTGHAEAVEVTYDPSQVTLGKILKVYFAIAHDPTELNRQGPDVGTQYRSAIFFTTPEQEEIARAYIVQLNAAKAFPSDIVTEVKPLNAFYPAEDYHQNYAALHPTQPYIVVNDLPKVANLKKHFPELYEDGE